MYNTQFPIGDNHLNNHTNNVLAMLLQSCKHKKTRNSCRIKFEGDQREKDCYHGDEHASRDPRSVETRPHAKRGNPTHSTHFTDRRGYALWPSSLVWTVQRRDADNVTRRVVNLAIPGTRRRGRPKKTWHQQLKEDMTGVGVTQDVALDQTEWRRRTRPTPRR